jgi:hypothetical protein
MLDEIADGRTDLLPANGESLDSLGDNFGLIGACRDCRTRGEPPLHRAAAFGDEEAIQDAGAIVDARGMNDDSPLTWASWHLRPEANLRGKPQL